MDNRKREGETMTEFAQRAIEGFVVTPYEEVDKELREGVREAVLAHKLHAEEMFNHMEACLNGE